MDVTMGLNELLLVEVCACRHGGSVVFGWDVDGARKRETSAEKQQQITERQRPFMRHVQK